MPCKNELTVTRTEMSCQLSIYIDNDIFISKNKKIGERKSCTLFLFGSWFFWIEIMHLGKEKQKPKRNFLWRFCDKITKFHWFCDFVSLSRHLISHDSRWSISKLNRAFHCVCFDFWCHDFATEKRREIIIRRRCFNSFDFFFCFCYLLKPQNSYA